jgi:SAC3/GANP family
MDDVDTVTREARDTATQCDGEVRPGKHVQEVPFLYCSEAEVLYRQRTHDIDILETAASSRSSTSIPTHSMSRLVLDPSRAVKKYYRSGSEMLHAQGGGVRSVHQLGHTTMYLLQIIWPQRHDRRYDIGVYYSFISNRLRAVRQDLVTMLDSPVSTSTGGALNSYLQDMAQAADICVRMCRFYWQCTMLAFATSKVS